MDGPEANSVSPDGMSLAQYAYRTNVHLATCAMPPKTLWRQPHLASGLTATHRKPGRTDFLGMTQVSKVAGEQRSLGELAVAEQNTPALVESSA